MMKIVNYTLISSNTTAAAICRRTLTSSLQSNCRVCNKQLMNILAQLSPRMLVNKTDVRNNLALNCTSFRRVTRYIFRGSYQQLLTNKLRTVMLLVASADPVNKLVVVMFISNTDQKGSFRNTMHSVLLSTALSSPN